ncbi:hypothetical protein F5884DRAFT_750346 [Xylogone sp. PMI_703]|nr:hypothetical protein F5884DRAFT_750346 [Xylogone sp. PMI_703]
MSPSRTLPAFTQADVAAHTTSQSCYVTMGNRVFDVTDFVEGHPGGGELVMEYAGKDVTEILNDKDSHFHSETAYEVLEESLVGFLVQDKMAKANGQSDGGKQNGSVDAAMVYPNTGMASEEDLSKETDLAEDFKTHKFLDLNKPLLLQILFGGFSKEFYLDQIHRPRHYKGGASAPLFGNFLEPLSKTPWYAIPTIWLPPVAYGTYIAREGLSSVFEEAAYWLLGLALWTLVEYVLHRFLFHLDGYLPDHPVALTLHFLLHGIHHYLPMDKLRLVMPPTLFLALATPFWKLAHFVFYYNWHAATAVFCGGIFGYICYDLTHYFLHHRTLPAYMRQLKKHHLEHHFMDYQNGFGVTSPFWDWVFGTELVPPPMKTLKTL